VDERPYFDIPVTYNSKVKFWINFYQTSGRKWFRTWLERSHAYLPQMQSTLASYKMPQDLAYVAMIESGFSAHATSNAEAVGYWQFIGPTANRYGLKTNWWLDERRDFSKSTFAAARYLGDLYRMFDSWYLTAAAYNMGEGNLKKLVAKYHTKNYWLLSRKAEFPDETREYIPKLLAAMLIAKAPALYGFTDIKPQAPYKYEFFHVPGGTDLYSRAAYLNLNTDVLQKLNPELVKGYVPQHIQTHRIRIPLGFTASVSRYLRNQF
jgi:membrane-bound lytic murein transglycosylase D